METRIQKIDREHMKKEDFSRAAKLIQSGELVAFPTETVYGLGGNALDCQASGKIYAAKGRPSDNPLIVHIADVEALTELAEDIRPEAYELAKRFWPGPLTMILKKRDIVPLQTTGGLNTVAIRMPSDEIARMLIRESGCFIAAPSANASGRPSPTKASHVYEDLKGRIELILDGGAVQIGLESTIVDLSEEIPLILRPGYITYDDLKEILPDIEYDKAVISKKMQPGVVAKAPGMKYRHYAPKGDLVIYEGAEHAVIKTINHQVEKALSEGKTAAVLATEETLARYPKGIAVSVGTRQEEATIAANLFDVLRGFDERNIECIFSESFETGKLGQAIMNRLLKAAGYQVRKAEE